MTIDYAELKRLAERVLAIESTQDEPIQVAWDEFESAANPTVILALIAENERLQSFKAAYFEWQDKTQWVQDRSQVHECGMHRADALKGRIDQLKAEVEALRKIISESATACGAAVSVECSLEFMQHLPGEIASVLGGLRNQLPSAEMVWCACGDGYPVNSYGAGFMDANNGVCANCDAALSKDADHG
ncbi:hypothetical protein [Pseudomonas typographi]|uniref:hypothetical protein n=1 Tax=Pseudomonas typographi TaxID=2715964 RepID=UPI001687E645|nr:hypothetical protein [Pseudomonas typographi]MBD1589760.1 hypothetical protein [Pseudomonas typographi]